MAPRLTVKQFASEVFDQRSPLIYAVAVVLGATRAGSVYESTANVPEALLLGGVFTVALVTLMCAVTWFISRLRGA